MSIAGNSSSQSLRALRLRSDMWPPSGGFSRGNSLESNWSEVMSIPPKRRAVKTPRRYSSHLRQAQAAATRRQIVDAALSVFLEHGYAGATMQRIAAAAGVVVETIYRTFDGKAG